MLFVLHTLYKSKEVIIFKAFTKCKHGNPVEFLWEYLKLENPKGRLDLQQIYNQTYLKIIDVIFIVIN